MLTHLKSCAKHHGITTAQLIELLREMPEALNSAVAQSHNGQTVRSMMAREKETKFVSVCDCTAEPREREEVLAAASRSALADGDFKKPPPPQFRQRTRKRARNEPQR